jgi:hypothetical protein
MSTPRVRPRFTIEVDVDPDQLMERLRKKLPGCSRCTGVSAGRHVELFVPSRERRVWSPWLSVTVEEAADGAVLNGRFAPHPSIWTLYLFLAFGIVFVALIGVSWGYAQWVMGQTPWALASLPGAILLGGALFSVSLFGQRLGAEQMLQLRAALEDLTLQA